MGLAPIVVQGIFRTLREINAGGLTIFLVEQNVRQALKIAERAYVLENGRVVLQGSGRELLDEPRVQAGLPGRLNAPALGDVDPGASAIARRNSRSRSCGGVGLGSTRRPPETASSSCLA